MPVQILSRIFVTEVASWIRLFKCKPWSYYNLYTFRCRCWCKILIMVRYGIINSLEIPRKGWFPMASLKNNTSTPKTTITPTSNNTSTYNNKTHKIQQHLGNFDRILFKNLNCNSWSCFVKLKNTFHFILINVTQGKTND